MGQYIVALAASAVMFDGSTQPAGTALNRILCDADWVPDPAHTPNCPQGATLQLVADTGQQCWQPPQPPPTTIDPYDFMLRFSAAEQQAVQTAAQSQWQIQMWMTQLAAAEAVDVTAAKITGGMAALVAAGLVSQARGAQILDLAAASP